MIDDELEAVRKVGAPVHRLVGVPLEGCGDRHVLRYPRQATFHPLKYLAGLVEKIVAKGGAFFADTVIEKSSKRTPVTVTSFGWRESSRQRRGRCYQLADLPISLPSHQNGTLPQLCHGVRDQGGRASRRAVLGHARSLSLCAPAAWRKADGLRHRRRRGSQKR